MSEELILEEEIDDVLKLMETNYDDKLVDRLSKLQERFEAEDGYTIQSKAEEL